MGSSAWVRTSRWVRPVVDRFGRGWSLPPRRLAGPLAALLAGALGLVLLLRPATPAYGAPLAPDFTLPVVSGGHGLLSLRALRGHPVLLNFFQSDCGACIAEAPVLRAATQDYKSKGVVVLGIATGGDSAIKAWYFAMRHRLSYPIVVGERGDAINWRYNVGSWPASFFIDARGRVQAYYSGQLDDGLVRAGLAQAGAISCDNCAALPRTTFGADGADATRTSLAGLAPSFALRDQHGAVVSPATLRGKVVALTFLSAVCTEQCPLAGRTLAEVRRQLGKDASRYSVVVISADPENDSPAATARFARESGWRGLDWHYLTGPRAALQRVWKTYGVYVEKPSPIFKGGAGLVHDSRLFLINPRGQRRELDAPPYQAPQVALTVRALLAS